MSHQSSLFGLHLHILPIHASFSLSLPTPVFFVDNWTGCINVTGSACEVFTSKAPVPSSVMYGVIEHSGSNLVRNMWSLLVWKFRSFSSWVVGPKVKVHSTLQLWKSLSASRLVQLNEKQQWQHAAVSYIYAIGHINLFMEWYDYMRKLKLQHAAVYSTYAYGRWHDSSSILLNKTGNSFMSYYDFCQANVIFVATCRQETSAACWAWAF